MSSRSPVASSRELVALVESQYQKGLTNYLQVIDADRTLLGVTTLRRLLRVKPEDHVGDIMETRLVTVRPEDSPRTVAEVFQKYSQLTPLNRMVDAARGDSATVHSAHAQSKTKTKLRGARNMALSAAAAAARVQNVH